MIPSRRLIILVLPAAALFLGGAALEPLAALGVIYLLVVGAHAAVDALLLPGRRRIRVRRILPERLSLGVPTPAAFEVENTARRRLEVRLAERLPQGVDVHGGRCAGVFGPRARGTLRYRLVARARGRYTWDHVDVRVLPRGGLFCRQFRLRLPAEVHVYPNLVNTRRYELMVRRGLLYEEGVAPLRLAGAGGEFESLRLYASGDDMARVDWKATARRGQLIVRNYEPQRQQSILIAIDVGQATAGEFQGLSRLDHFVNAALMMAYVALRQHDWVSLVAFSDRIESYLPPVRGLASVERVARSLYELRSRLVAADYAGACRFLGLRNRKRSLICLMTDVIDRDANAVMIAYLARFARHHLPLAVVLRDPEIDHLAEQPLAARPDPYVKAAALDVTAAREEALTAMRRHGVSVLDADPRRLTPELINRYLLIKSTRRL